jgi:hypothetical protein
MSGARLHSASSILLGFNPLLWLNINFDSRERPQETLMKNRRISSLGMLAMVLTLGIGLVFSGCATSKASTKAPNMDKKPIAIADRDYTILGTVKLEKKWFGILGFSIPSVGVDAYTYQNGGVTYSDLLDEARKQYPDADAVVDINIDFEGSTYAIFYSQRANIATGMAIKYVKEPRTE